MMKRLLVGLLAGATVLGLTACGASASREAAVQTEKISAVVSGELTDTAVYGAAKSPKYVFLFIGDGMSYPQFQAASDYLGAMADEDYMQAEPSVKDRQGAKLDGPEALNFMNFDVAGSAVTYDSCSFAPDSASTATSIATGYKTYSGMINTDETGTKTYETIAEKLHSQKGWKVGVISSVNLNHATPAAFYAHQASRNNYYEIGVEMVESGFEYFAGGALKKPTGNNKDKTSLYDLAKAAGYKVTTTQADAAKVTAKDGKVIFIDEHLADSDAMDYELDRQQGEWALADAVQVAVDFAKQHPKDTLILVTGDHESGGLTIGYAGTDYDTYLTNLASQTISYA